MGDPRVVWCNMNTVVSGIVIGSGQLRIPSHIRILHVEQEVEGDDTSALQSVLECDTKREGLLKEEREISAKLNASR